MLANAEATHLSDASFHPGDEAMLSSLQRDTFDYFVKETNPENGLVADRDHDGAPASIAAVGMALTAYPVGAARGYLSRTEARARTLTTLRFLWQLPQGTREDDSGHRGFFYHFIDMQAGRRVWNCELSTIDTAILIAGALAAACYFDEPDREETEIRELADALYRRVDWRWAEHGGETVALGWKPRSRFLKYRWHGYDESIIMHVLGLASPTHPLSLHAYHAYLRSFRWRTVEDQQYLHADPLFIHQLSHIWIDFRGIQDDFMRRHGIDYFENSRRATYAQRAYAIRNPNGFVGYGENCWGITASDGPGPAQRRVHGVRRRFYDYLARGIPDGPDDGTLSPWAVATSLPFAPEIVLPALRHLHEIGLRDDCSYGFTASFNPTFGVGRGHRAGWIAPETIAINQGPMALMIENHRSDFLWTLMRRCRPITDGLRLAGFSGGWLDEDSGA